MKVLSKKDLRLFEKILQLSQPGLLRAMEKYLTSKYKTVHRDQNFLYAVGDIPVAIVAHLDTVFTTPPKDIFYDKEKNVMWSPDGMGADDRAGVFGIIQILKAGLKPTIILTTDEEKGALGAYKLIKHFPKAPSELKYIIQLDRRGSNDCVFYDCANAKFEEYVETFGFITNFGTFTDISIICPAWGMAGVNLSIGYYDEHSYCERLYVNQMFATIRKVMNMVKDIDTVKKKFDYIPAKNYGFFKSNKNNKDKAYAYGFDDDDDYGWDPSYGVSKSLWRSWHEPKEMITCFCCSTKNYDYEMFPTKDTSGKTIFLCSECVCNIENLSWCECCGEPFLVKAEDSIDNTCFCYDCQERGIE